MPSVRPRFRINVITILACVVVVVAVITGLKQHDPVGMATLITLSALFALIINLVLYGWFVELTQAGIAKISLGIFRQSINYKDIERCYFDYPHKTSGQGWPGVYTKTILKIHGKDGSTIMNIPTRPLSQADVASIIGGLERHGVRVVEP